MTKRPNRHQAMPHLDAPRLGTVTVPPRFADAITENTYALTVEGVCLAPDITDGDMVIATPDRTPRAGEFAVIYPRGGGKPVVKRLVLAVPETLDVHPNSEVMPLVIAEQLNPPKVFRCPADKLIAVHAVIGWMKPDEVERLRKPAPEEGGAS